MNRKNHTRVCVTLSDPVLRRVELLSETFDCNLSRTIDLLLSEAMLKNPYVSVLGELSRMEHAEPPPTLSGRRRGRT
jgi:hypothetical protein